MQEHWMRANSMDFDSWLAKEEKTALEYSIHTPFGLIVLEVDEKGHPVALRRYDSPVGEYYALTSLNLPVKENA